MMPTPYQTRRTLTLSFFATLVLTALVAKADQANFVESNTGAEFPRQLTSGDRTLQLTGADRRRELGRNAYALAHYIGYETDSARTTKQLLGEFSTTDQPKAILLKGVYSKVPARGIRWAWKRGLKRAGFTDTKSRKDFVGRFKRAFLLGDELLFDATDPNRLVVTLNDELFGEWENPALVRAIWTMCVGENADLENPSNLANPDLL